MFPHDRLKSPLLLLIVLLAGGITLLGAVRGPGGLSSPPPPAPAGTAAPPYVSSTLAVFFTDPNLDGFRGGPERALIAAVDAAHAEVDVAAYDLDLWGLRDALIGAHRRGVRVRLVVDDGNRANPEIEAIAAAGVPVIADGPDGLMHHKFAVIDRRQVWTGSMNFTLNGAYRNDNHLISLDSPQAAEAFRAEFEEMFAAGLFGAYSPPGTAVTVPLETGLLEIWFSPDDDAGARIAGLVRGAVHSVRFLAFSFTADEIGEAMLERLAAGVPMQGVFDESQLRSNTGSEFDFLHAAGAAVRIDGSRDKMHHKLILIDDRIVVFGSYNFSRSAEIRNDENVLVLFDEDAAQAFLVEWERVFGQARDPVP